MPFIRETVLSYRGQEAWKGWRERNSDFDESMQRWWTPDGQRPPASKETIDLSIAENTLMVEELKAHVKVKFPDTLNSVDFTYGEGPGGSTRLREHLKDYINTYFKIPESQLLDKQNIVTIPGVYAAMEQISWACANPGDGILVGRPYYGGFISGFTTSRSRVKIVGVEFNGIDPFSLEAVDAYRTKMKQTDEDGTPIKAILLCNPCNPLGRCYSREVLSAFVSLCTSKNIHLISDEIYALSHFVNPFSQPSNQLPFTSLLSLPTSAESQSLIHVLYGMSKDFGSSGVRLGAVVSRNDTLINAVLTNSFLSWVSSAADVLWSCILSDRAFTATFIRKNQARLGRCYATVTGDLRRHGIAFDAEGNAGVFVWIDLSYALGNGSEEELNERLIEGGVKLSPGRKFRAEKDGWFRLTFSRPEETLVAAVERIVATVGTPEVPV